MIAANSSTPYMPRLLTVIAAALELGLLQPALAGPGGEVRVARATSVTDRRSTPVSTGVTRPFSVATATATSTPVNERIASPVQTTFISGTCWCAFATALTTQVVDRDA